MMLARSRTSAFRHLASTQQRSIARNFSTNTSVVGKDRLVIFDTTLRDGEQSPGATLNMNEKVEIAKLLSQFGVDVCEAGFPIASPGDFEAVKKIAQEVGPSMDGREATGQPMRIAGLCRAHEKDIQRCYDAVKHAPLHRIHTFLATSDIHLEHKLKISRDECIERAAKAVRFAASLSEDVEFSAEDACRSDPAFLVEVFKAVIAEGATTINIPDTVGFTTPAEYQRLFEYLIANTGAGSNVVWSTHCHNDLGLASANTLAGIAGGARQVEVTVNGLGERAGNTAIEEICMALKTRPTEFPCYTTLNPKLITRLSRMVSTLSSMPVQPNKAIVGANAFAHESGIHQDGVIKNALTYEIISPETIGLNSSRGFLVLGKHSGRAAYRQRLEELGYKNLSQEQIDDFVDKFKRIADEKKVVTDADIEAIVNDEMFQPEHTWELKSIHVVGGNLVKATATVSLVHTDGHEVVEAAIGAGPVDAIYQAIQKIVRVPNRLVNYGIASVTQGLDALGEVTTKIQFEEEKSDSAKRLQRSDSSIIDVSEVKNPQSGAVSLRSFTGHAADTDILVASAKSYISALNKMIAHKKQQKSIQQ